MMTHQEDCISKYFQNKIDSKIIIPLPRISNTPTKSQESPHNLSQSSITSETDNLSLSQLTIEEQDLLTVQPFYNITPRRMPVSPHYIFEEEFASNPWAILIATIFLTKTSGINARPFMKSFFEKYPTPYHVLGDSPTSLEIYFTTLGLRKRALMIWKLSYQFVSSKWRRASDLCGIGKYGEDAYRIFCLGHSDLNPTDRYLKLYLDWLRGHTDYLVNNGIVDCECILEDPVLKYYMVALRDNE